MEFFSQKSRKKNLFSNSFFRRKMASTDPFWLDSSSAERKIFLCLTVKLRAGPGGPTTPKSGTFLGTKRLHI